MNTKELQSIVFILDGVAMFTTTFRDQLLGPVSFGSGDKVTTWRRMTIELQDPYFLIEYQISFGDTLMGETVIVHFLDDLLGICEQANEDSRLFITGVQLLSPRRINETASWKLEELREIWRHSGDFGDQITFVTSSGILCDRGQDAVEKDYLETGAQIWEMPTRPKSASEPLNGSHAFGS